MHIKVSLLYLAKFPHLTFEQNHSELCCILVFLGIAFSFIIFISFSETSTKPTRSLIQELHPIKELTIPKSTLLRLTGVLFRLTKVIFRLTGKHFSVVQFLYLAACQSREAASPR